MHLKRKYGIEKIYRGSDIVVFLIIIITDGKKLAGWRGGVRFMKGGGMLIGGLSARAKIPSPWVHPWGERSAQSVYKQNSKNLCGFLQTKWPINDEVC